MRLHLPMSIHPRLPYLLLLPYYWINGSPANEPWVPVLLASIGMLALQIEIYKILLLSFPGSSLPGWRPADSWNLETEGIYLELLVSTYVAKIVVEMQ